MQTVLKRREYRLEDVTPNDLRMLAAAASMPEKSWYCFGSAWYKLFELELIDDENRTTELGKSLVRYMSKERM